MVKNSRNKPSRNGKRPQKRNSAPRRRAGPAGNTLVRAGRHIGGLIVPGIGSTVGGLIGSGLQNAYNHITGRGDYTVAENTLMTGSIPTFGSSDRKITVRHREFLSDVVTGAANSFSIAGYSINPGVNTTFPWLSTIADSFESYRLNGLIFEYRSTSSDALNSTNTALGSVILSTQYNVYNPPFTNKQSMDAHEFTVSTKPSMNIIHAVECKRDLNVMSELYVRNVGFDTTNEDLRFYDHGRFYIATNGFQAANVTVGELWVSYDVELLKPELPRYNGAICDRYQLLPTVTPSLGTLFDGATKLPLSNLGTILNNAVPLITIPPVFVGDLFIALVMFGTLEVAGVTDITANAVGDCAIVSSSFYNGAIPSVKNSAWLQAGATTNPSILLVRARVGSGAAAISLLGFPTTTLPVNLAAGDLYIMAVPPV